MTACGRSAKAKRVCRCSAGVKECQGQSKIRWRNRAGKRAQLVRVCGCFRAAYLQGDAKGGKSIHDDFSRTAGRSAFITPSLFMAVTLAECLADAWQSGPRTPSASHWLRQAPSGRSEYPLIGGGGRTTDSAAGTGRLRAGSNNATCLPRARPAPPSQSQGLVLAANVLAGLIAPPFALASWSHALPRNAQALMRTLSDLPLCFCFSRSSDSSAHLWWVPGAAAAAWVGNESPGLSRRASIHWDQRTSKHPGSTSSSPNWPPRDANTKRCCYVKQMPLLSSRASASLSTPSFPQLEADAKFQRWAGSARWAAGWAGWAGQEITLRVPSAWRPVVPDSRCHSSEYHQPGSTQPPHRLEHSFQRAG
jgi:hypothetical protein